MGLRLKSTFLRNIDLNLLVILDVLLQERSVSRTAHRLNVTASAVSHALGRLRTLFDDELLIRDGRQMRPTVRAKELSESLPRALSHVASTLEKREPFDFATSNRTFRLAAPDFVAPMVMSEVGRVAPDVRVEWVPNSPTAASELALGHYDAMIGSSGFKSEGLRGTDVGQCPWRVYGRAGHPAFEQWSIDAWAAYPHLQIGTSVIRGEGPIDKRISELGVSRRVSVVVPYFSMAAAVTAETDLLLTVPSMSIKASGKRYNLDDREVPFEMPQMSLSVFRSAINGDEPGVRWFLERIEVACRRL